MNQKKKKRIKRGCVGDLIEKGDKKSRDKKERDRDLIVLKKRDGWDKKEKRIYRQGRGGG